MAHLNPETFTCIQTEKFYKKGIDSMVTIECIVLVGSQGAVKDRVGRHDDCYRPISWL